MSAAKPTLTDAMGKLHRASCILGYVSENALREDEVHVGETLKSAEALMLDAMNVIRELQP